MYNNDKFRYLNESLTTEKREKKKLLTFETWGYGSILKIRSVKVRRNKTRRAAKRKMFSKKVEKKKSSAN